MSDLQIGLIALGVLFILLVLGFNWWQDRRVRRKMQVHFPGSEQDPLLGEQQARWRALAARAAPAGASPASAAMRPRPLRPPSTRRRRPAGARSRLRGGDRGALRRARARRGAAAARAGPASRGPQAGAGVRADRRPAPPRPHPSRRILRLGATGRAAGQPQRSADRHRVVAGLGPRLRPYRAFRGHCREPRPAGRAGAGRAPGRHLRRAGHPGGPDAGAARTGRRRHRDGHGAGPGLRRGRRAPGLAGRRRRGALHAAGAPTARRWNRTWLPPSA